MYDDAITLELQDLIEGLSAWASTGRQDPKYIHKVRRAKNQIRELIKYVAIECDHVLSDEEIDGIFEAWGARFRAR